MKVRPSVKPICEKCKVIKRKGKVMVICDNSARANSLTFNTHTLKHSEAARLRIGGAS